jgi:D-alanyl-D-alanine carboxypeptidase (penicillin-binding protein 5/6)
MTARRLVAAAAATLALGLVATVTGGAAVAGTGAVRAGDPIGGPGLASDSVVVDGPAPPVIHAKAWILADVDTGDVLAAYHAHRRLRPASTLKTLTAVTLLPTLDKSTEYRATYADAVAEGSRVGLVPGLPYTVDQLFYGLFLPSGNDAAHALANAAGGMPHTVELMQAEAAHLQADDTHVVNASGLDAPGQRTSVYDLALFARAGLTRSDFRHYCSTVSVAFPGRRPKHPGKPRQTYRIYNQNPMLYDGFDGAIGVKTGYTTLAGRTFVGAAERHGHTLVAALMGIRDTSATDAEHLLSWGFHHRGELSAVGTLVPPLPVGADDVRVASGTGAEPVAAATAGSSVPFHLLRGVLWPLLVIGVIVAAVVLRRRQVNRRRAQRADWKRRNRALRH